MAASGRKGATAHLVTSRTSIEAPEVKAGPGSSEEDTMRPNCLQRAVRSRSLTALAVAGSLTAAVGAVAPAAHAVAPAVAPAAQTSTSAPALTRTAPAAATGRLSATDTRMRAVLSTRAAAAGFGVRFSGTVVDVGTGATVWSSRGGTTLMPASTTKLVTATNALSVFGPTHRFTTTVRRGSTWHDVVLVGSGDPSLSTADLTVLARATAAQVRAHGARTVRVWADDYLFARPSLARGWKTSYVPAEVRHVRALVVDQSHAADTALNAAGVFARTLRAAGVRTTTVRRAAAPKGSPLLASVQGDDLRSIVTTMLQVSDNDHAEALHRLVSLAERRGTSWTGARAAQRAVLAREGVRLPDGRLWDGSGLSRSDRLTSAELARVVAHAFAANQPELAVLRENGLPLSGRTGTLSASAGRFVTKDSSCARGLVRAKTGSLGDAAALAGWTRGADGRLKAFAFVVNGKKANLTLKRKLDVLAATVTGCR
jgi:D-alanyl-D-alanine carboxypeptidase/D-alanyl-D-alanine-endopeptidase (penicillin-binding protein 4)